MPQPPFAASQRFRRADGFVLKARPDSGFVVEFAGASVVGSAHTLAILEAFSQPCTLEQGLAKLRSGLALQGAQGWMDLTSEVVNLAKLGVLSDPDRTQPVAARPASGFAGCSVHHRMLDDRTRTERFLQAIGQTVLPGDVVVDIGTGSGILAIAAARAGAARVYAVESTGIAELAEAMFRANGVDDRVTLVKGLSTEIELPERADVLVCELIGNDPLDERIQEVCRDAAKRLLKPGARMIPSRLWLRALPMAMPVEALDGHLATDAKAEVWHGWYGIDFAAFAGYTRNQPQYAWIRAQEASGWQPLAEPVTLAELGLLTLAKTFDGASAPGMFLRDGALNGILLCFDAELAPGVELSTDPARVGRDNHWSSLVRLLDPGWDARAGEPFRIDYSPRRHGEAARLNVRLGKELA